MKKLIILLLLASLVHALELPVEIVNQNTATGPNCLSNDAPYGYSFSVNVYNPSQRTIKVYYSWYEFATSKWSEKKNAECAGGLGYIEPGKLVSCKVTLYPMLGGTNGTANIDFLVIGNDDINEYKKGLGAVIIHSTAPYEDNVVDKISYAESELEKANLKVDTFCYGGACCGMGYERSLLSSANIDLRNSNLSLMSCQLSPSWKQATDALIKINKANGLIGLKEANCTALLLNISAVESNITSTANLFSERVRCGVNTAAAASYLKEANKTLQDARAAISVDNYTITLQKLNATIDAVSKSIELVGPCPQTQTPQPNATANITQNQPAKNETVTTTTSYPLEQILGVVVAIILLAGLLFIFINWNRGRVQPPKEEPKKLSPEEHEDLETEFEDWLKTQKKEKKR